MSLQQLIDAGARYVFHASSAEHIDKVADGGVVLAAARVPGAEKKSGSRKDMRGGGADFVYCRLIIENSPCQIGHFGTRSGLAGRIYYVVPIAKIAEYGWFISSVDLNGKLPTGMMKGDYEQSESSRNGTIRGIVGTIAKGERGTANYEIGLNGAIQISDLSHVVVTRETSQKYATQLFALKQSAAQMQSCLAVTGTASTQELKIPDIEPLKIVISQDGQTAWKAIAGI